jgi:RND family efflux transporter MFP subunit
MHPHPRYRALRALFTLSRTTTPLVLCAIALSGCARKKEVEPPPVPAVLTEVARSRAEQPFARRGVVSSGARLKLGFAAGGILDKLPVHVGDAVKKGQLLASLRSSDAGAHLRVARAGRKRARQDFTLSKNLASAGALASQQLDVASTQLEVAEANAMLAAEVLAQRRLVSPVTGAVLMRLAEPGETVGAGMPVLVLEDTSRLLVRMGVNERERERITVAQRALLRHDDGSVPLNAEVTSIAPAPGPDGLYAVELSTLAEDRPKWAPGTMVTVELSAPSEQRVHVPLDALVHRADKTWVFVVASAGREVKAELRELAVDRVRGRDVGVRAGLREGDRFIREGAQFLTDGQTVHVID